MVQINFARKEINCKIVYYGPGLSGKTTSLEVVHQKSPEGSKGELTSISTDGDRTLFFDFMPLDLGNIAGMQTKFHLYTVPGQVYYNSTRKLVLMGADGIIFVADSTPGRMQDNIQSMENLRQNLAEMGRDLAHTPLVVQFNKRDVPGATSLDEMTKSLNPYNAPAFESSAKTGEGVFQALKAVSARVLEDINTSEKRVKRVQPKQQPVAPQRAPEVAAEAGGAPSPAGPVTANAPTSAPKAAPSPLRAVAQAEAGAADAAVAVAEQPLRKSGKQTKPRAAPPSAPRENVVEPVDEEPAVRPKRSEERAAARRPKTTRRTGGRVTQQASSVSPGKIVIYAILGVVAGGVAAVLAAEYILGVNVLAPILETLKGASGK